MTAARCTTHPERDWLWFSTEPDAQSYAVAICNRCPVKAWCAKGTPADDRWTTRGGLTAADRVPVFVLLEPTAARIGPTVQGCGTHAAYTRGCRCSACHKGHAAYIAERRAAVTAPTTLVVEMPDQLNLLEIA